MNILYFSPIRLLPTGHGNIATVHQYLRRLKNTGHRVHYVLYNESCCNEEDLFYSQDFVDTLDVIPFNNSRRNNQRDNVGYYHFDSFYEDGMGEKLRRLCAIYNIDVIICTYIMYSKILEYIPDTILKIIDTHDKMSDRHLDLKKNSIKDEFFSCTKEDEAQYLNRADLVWARRDEETAYFNKITNSNKTTTVSHFDTPNFIKKDYSTLKNIGFLASDNEVNAKMVRDFVNLYSKQYPQGIDGLNIIIGGNVNKLLEEDTLCMQLCKESNIAFYGKFEELIDFYTLVDAVLVPISFGTGINVKMIEAMSFGLPILSTKVGIKGVTSSARYHQAQNLEELLEMVQDLHANPSKINELHELSCSLYQEFYMKQTKSFDSFVNNYHEKQGKENIKVKKAGNQSSVIDEDAELIEEIVTSLKNQSALPYISTLSYEECKQSVEVLIQELKSSGEGHVDYSSSNANIEFNYYDMHKERFAQTLSFLPLATDNEKVLEVGSLGAFSILLDNVLGYKDITCLDKIESDERIIRTSRTILDKEYAFDCLNVDLNSKTFDLPEKQFDKIFCFEVLEHLWYPMKTLALFRHLLKPNGELFITVPNCCSALALRKLLQMQIPMVWNGYDDILEKSHYKEFTPISLNYVLAHAGFETQFFTSLYCASTLKDIDKVIQNLYPFPQEPELNKKLQGDTLIAISKPNLNVQAIDDHPNMLYNTGAYLDSYFSKYPDTYPFSHYFK